MYPNKTVREISRALSWPTFIFGGLFLGGGGYLFSPSLLFAGIWCVYQGCLWAAATKKKSVEYLPLYQIMDDKFSNLYTILFVLYAILRYKYNVFCVC